MEVKIPPKVFKELKPDDDPVEWYDSMGYCRFPKMDAEASELYERLKGTNQDLTLMDMREQTESMKDGSVRYRRTQQGLAALVFYMTDTQNMSYQDVAKITGLPYNTIKGMAWRKRYEEGDA